VTMPNYEACMLPLLKALADGEVHSTRSVASQIEDHFNLSEEERERMLPSGTTRYIINRIGWAKTYLKNAGLLINPSRGQIQITDAGRALLATNPTALTGKDLEAYPSFVEFTERNRPAGVVQPPIDRPTPQPEITPDEAMEAAHTEIREALASELLEQVRAASPTFFERLVLDLLIAMGYGGGLADASSHVGRSGDGGIDGIINEDKLGLDMICVQAKRWAHSVGRPELQGFSGSMEAHRAKKGVMITTSTFTREARDFVDRVERKIVLIDGQQLAQLMIEFNVGVATARTFTVKKIDTDYFLDGD
jgi:restriction system protein